MHRLWDPEWFRAARHGDGSHHDDFARSHHGFRVDRNHHADVAPFWARFARSRRVEIVVAHVHGSLLRVYRKPCPVGEHKNRRP
jgi:hypothetical protein